MIVNDVEYNRENVVRDSYPSTPSGDQTAFIEPARDFYLEPVRISVLY